MAQYRGLVVGSRGAEWVGKVVVKCEQTGLSAKLNFKPLGWLGMWGSWHRVEVWTLRLKSRTQVGAGQSEE